METLEQLYKAFYIPSNQRYLKSIIEQNHGELIDSLSKLDKKKVLAIIDTGSLITDIQTRESFVCGFQLAMDLCMELQYHQQKVWSAEE